MELTHLSVERRTTHRLKSQKGRIHDISLFVRAIKTDNVWSHSFPLIFFNISSRTSVITSNILDKIRYELIQ